MSQKDQIEPCWITEAKATRIIDGDTIEVTIERKFNIRFENIDIFEKSTEKGAKAKEYLEDILLGETVLVHIPTNDPVKLVDFTSFERIVGTIYLEGENVSEIMRNEGFEK